MILLDTDHTTYLKYPDSDRGRRLIGRMQSVSETETFGVAIVTVEERMRGWLATIHNVLVQPRPPAEILVIDDASSDDTPAVAAQFGPLSDRSGCVRYRRVDVRDVHRARAPGVAATRASVVCFLDADDILPPDDLEAGVPLWDDPAVGIESADVERFGDQTGRIEYPAQPGNRIHQENFVHAGSLVRHTALERSPVFEISCAPLANDDWFSDGPRLIVDSDLFTNSRSRRDTITSSGSVAGARRPVPNVVGHVLSPVTDRESIAVRNCFSSNA